MWNCIWSQSMWLSLLKNIPPKTLVFQCQSNVFSTVCVYWSKTASAVFSSFLNSEFLTYIYCHCLKPILIWKVNHRISKACFLKIIKGGSKFELFKLLSFSWKQQGTSCHFRFVFNINWLYLFYSKCYKKVCLHEIKFLIKFYYTCISCYLKNILKYHQRWPYL